MYGNTVLNTVTLAIGENGLKVAYFLHSARCIPLLGAIFTFKNEPERTFYLMSTKCP